MVGERFDRRAEHHGFAIYVDLLEHGDEQTLHRTLDQIAHVIEETIATTVPSALVATCVSQVRSYRQEPGAAGVVVDLSRQRLFIDGELVPMPFREFKLLEYLLEREGKTVDRGELLTLEGGAEYSGSLRTIDVHIKRLREKCDPYGDIVRTVRGVGYRYDRHADVVVLSSNGDVR